MGKVTIIIPIYNAYETIDKCLDSVIKQTYKDIEVIIINDGSKDNSINKINKYAEQYQYIKVIDKKNEGVAKTRNLGIKKATGDYIMFIDQDDYIADDYVEQFVTSIRKNDNDVAIGGFKRVNEIGKVLYQMNLKNTYWSRYNIITPWAKIYKTDFLIKNKVDFFSYGIGEDVYFNILLYSKNPKVTITSYNGYFWLYNEKSVSNTSHKGLNEDLDILKLLDKINCLNTNDDIYINYYIRKFYIWYLLYSGKYSTKEMFIKENQRIKEWIKENRIVFKINPLSSKINGELLKNRLIVLIFLTIDKFHLMWLFATFYCKEKKEK